MLLSMQRIKQCYGGSTMDNQELQSLKIDGMGKFTGGEFNQVNISGTGTFTSDVKCNTMNVSGMGSTRGNLDCKQCKVSGTAKVEGTMKSQETEVSGTLKVIKELQADQLRVKGVVKTEDSLSVKTLDCSGMIHAAKDVNGENITVDGMLNVGGLLNCESLTMKLAGTSTISEIGASTIRVEEGYGNVVNFFSMFVPKKFKYSKLVVTVIEGDDIEIANTQAKIVRGANIKIGPNCIIDTVEYGASVTVDASSTVKYKVQI